MNKKRLIDYNEVRELFDKEFKETMKLIEDGETHLDNLAEGFTEADRVLFKLICLSPMTNADHIRAMSDEELAEFLNDCETCHICSEHERLSDNPFSRGEKCDMKCAGHTLDWLKQPYEENTND